MGGAEWPTPHGRLMVSCASRCSRAPSFSPLLALFLLLLGQCSFVESPSREAASLAAQRLV
eukprot:2989244-Pyramimonas_sp.AAC.1